MGEIADMHIDAMLLDEIEDNPGEYIREMGREAIWTTKEGVEIEVKEMETYHLKNTVAYLKKKSHNSRRGGFIDVMTDEIAFRKRLSERREEQASESMVDWGDAY